MDTTFKIVICTFLFISLGCTEEESTSSSSGSNWWVNNSNNSSTSSNGSMSNSTVTATETAYVTSPRLNTVSNMQDSSKDIISTQTDNTIMTSPAQTVPTSSTRSPPTSPHHPSPQDSPPNSTCHISHPTLITAHHTTAPSTTSVSTPTSEPPGKAIGPQTTFSKGTTFSTATTSTSSAAGLPSFKTGFPPQDATDSGSHSDTWSSAGSKPTSMPPNSRSAQAKGHVDTPSQLNVGSDATVVHQTPPLDPLLAGLVSAFIITAVVISLLLFLKLRRRDNQPEFRRLQDLPMDDMMEDTPLSMYSY